MEYARNYVLSVREAVINAHDSFFIFWYHTITLASTFDMEYIYLWPKSDSLIRMALTNSLVNATYK